MTNARRFKVFLGLSVLALVATSVVYLVQNPGRNTPPVPPVKAVDVEQAEVVIDGFNFARSEGTDSDWQLNAKRAEVSKETGLAKLHELDAVIGTGTGTVVTLTAEEGVFDTGTKAVELKGGDDGVVVRSSEGYEIRFEDLRWDDSTQELSTRNRVTITGDKMRLEGRGMVARADLQEVRITDGVRTVFDVTR